MCKTTLIVSGIFEFQVPRNEEIADVEIAHPFCGCAKKQEFKTLLNRN